MYRPFTDFRPEQRCISVIGSGGKTTLLRRLAEWRQGTVILTTPTHIFPFPGMPLVDTGAFAADRGRVLRELRAALRRSRVVCLGSLEASGKLAPPDAVLPFELLLDEADAVFVEADGAAGRPLKAHRPFEPVIPACSGLTVCVAGASGIGQQVSQACHCPELFAALAGITTETQVLPEHAAKVLNRESLADCCLVNQADTLPSPEDARLLCGLIAADAYPCSLDPPAVTAGDI